MAYAELCDIIEEQHDAFRNLEQHWVFKDTLDHQTPLKGGDPGYIGCPWSVDILWDDGTTPMEPLNSVAKDNPVSCANYAKEHDLLYTKGWKRFETIPNREMKMRRMSKHVQADDCRYEPVYMFAVQVPKSSKQALEFHSATLLSIAV
jgi:hypothetical protein